MLMGGSFDEDDIYSCPSNSSSNHAVVIVGYDDTEGYWFVRNSWGAGWGPDNDGHFKVAHDTCALQRTPYRADAFYLLATDWAWLPLISRNAAF